MKNKKKKGFTLVELIGALAVLAIAMTGISLAFNTSSNTWKNTKINLDLVSYNQSVAQNIKAQGKDKVKGIYDYIKSKNENSNACYIYFNQYEEIKNEISVNNFTDYKVASALKSYDECFKNNTEGKKYGAMVEISNIKMGENYYASYTVYEVKVTVWYFKQGQNSKSQTTFYIGR